MSRARQLLHAIYRQGYYLAMYSGVRALANLLRSRRSRLDPRLARLHGARLQDIELGDLTIRVHSRRSPAGSGTPAAHAMLSLQRPNSTLAGWRYRALCLTSHFGCGHLEVALWERRGIVTIYAIRNIASGKLVATELERRGLLTRYATPAESLALCLDVRLLPSQHRESVRANLWKKYERLHQSLARGSS